MINKDNMKYYLTLILLASCNNTPEDFLIEAIENPNQKVCGSIKYSDPPVKGRICATFTPDAPYEKDLLTDEEIEYLINKHTTLPVDQCIAGCIKDPILSRSGNTPKCLDRCK